MKIVFKWIGKTKNGHINEIICDYQARLSHYIPNEIIQLKESKNRITPRAKLKAHEASTILKSLTASDFVILLDEKGKNTSSVEFSRFFQDLMNRSIRQIVFIIGGPYGSDEILFKRANQILALSKMTFTHDLARAILLEQVYRAYSIIHGNQYHNE